MPVTAGTGIHWQVAQATSLQNIVFNMRSDGGTSNAQQVSERLLKIWKFFPPPHVSALVGTFSDSSRASLWTMDPAGL
jgi:hypothetical protein